jgi:outer membrane protein assembly factor BamB|tara:strand:- start:612 stop:1784 length:1173 start_codon:yes stop_codon:yes gene_type:complete
MNTSAKLSLRNQLITIFSVMFLASCSSLESLKFWDNDEIDLDEPRPLNTITNKFEAKRNWEIKFNGENSLGNFIPAFSGDNLFASDSSGNIKSISASSGKVNWDIETNFLSSGIAAGFGILIVSDLDGNVIAIDQKDGSELWSVNVKGEVLAPAAIDAKFIIVKTGSGDLMALDKITGEIKWSYRSKLPTLTIRGSSSPVIFENQIYATFDNGRLGVFQIDSGFPVWDGAISYVSGASELENIIDADSNPVIDSGLVFTTNYQGNLNIFDIAQKRSVWTAEASSFHSPVVLRGMMAVVESDSSIKSFSMKTFEESWSIDDYSNRLLSNPISFNGYMVVGDLEGFIHIIDPLNGKTISRKKISKKPIKSLISRSENFYVIDQGFSLYSISI